MSAEHEPREMQQAREAVYFFFAGVFREPPCREFIDHLLQPSGLNILEKLFAEHPALDRCRELAAEYGLGKWDLEDFQVDFESLFRVPGALYVYPFESVYRQGESANRAPRKSMLMGEQARQVARIYRDQGLAPAPSTSLFPDELNVELEFMGRLCRRAAAFLQSKETERAAEAIAGQGEFLKDHLLLWCFACLETVVANAETPLYRILAELLASFLEREQEAADDAPVDCVELKNRVAC